MKATLRYSTNKNGKPVVYQYSKMGMRWIRISIDKAEIMRATGQVKEICWGEQPHTMGVKCVQQWDDNGTHNSMWMQAA